MPICLLPPNGGCIMPNGQIGNFNLQQCVQIQTKSLYWNLREICLVYPFPVVSFFWIMSVEFFFVCLDSLNKQNWGPGNSAD